MTDALMQGFGQVAFAVCCGVVARAVVEMGGSALVFHLWPAGSASLPLRLDLYLAVAGLVAAAVV